MKARQENNDTYGNSVPSYYNPILKKPILTEPHTDITPHGLKPGTVCSLHGPVCCRCNINETLIKEVADAVVASGLRDAGYLYINIGK
jgi:hypothetical protein